MSMSDPIADMLTRVRNAIKAKFDTVDIPGSNIKLELAKILKQEGFIKNYKFTQIVNRAYCVSILSILKLIPMLFSVLSA